MSKALAKKVLLIGWDAADWKVINPLMDSGQMPALEKLVNNGVIANLATLDPPLSPMLWTSIATGKKADKHGILGFAEPDSQKGGIRPVNVTSRKVKAIWNILHKEGMKSNVVGWWPSHPAEPINGTMISNFYQQANAEYGKIWKMLKGTIHPKSMVKELRSMRVHPGELTENHILPFVPLAAKIDQKKDKRITSVAKITADAASIQASSTHLMENTDWDFMAVYFDSIDHYCHGFMKFHPPQRSGIPDNLFEYYKDVVKGGYIYHDMMLERLLQLADKDTTVILISDHGFHSDHLRPESLPKIPAAPALEHSPYGIFCVSGPNIKKDERIYGASLLDITPTILTMFGLPVGKDMDGKVLTNIFDKKVIPEIINSWEEIEGDFGTHPPTEQEDAFESAEALQQLVELGYIEDPGKDKKIAMEKTANEAKYNLSRVHSSNKNYSKAIDILEKLFEKDNKDIRYNLDLANNYLKVQNFEKTTKILKHLRTIDNRAIPNADLLEGILLTNQGKSKKALEFLKKAEKSNPRLPGIHIELGKLYLITRRYEKAQTTFEKALSIDDSSVGAFHGLGLSLLRQGKYEEAANEILNAIGLIYHFPPAHYHLGETLFMMKKYKESSEAFEVCLTMAPKLTKARKWLVNIYQNNYKNIERAEFHQNVLNELMKGKVTIVSGLPRAGTSLMMQMLEAGGIEVLVDDKRKANENNPKGYYEYSSVKKLRSNNSCIYTAEGKSVKVIAQLLANLPKDLEYKIIFMQRNMYEILSSQQKMLGKKGNAFPMGIAKAFEKELEKIDVWQKKEPNVNLIYVDYKSVIENPDTEINKINEFLDFQLDTDKMKSVIDPNLYRNKV